MTLTQKNTTRIFSSGAGVINRQINHKKNQLTDNRICNNANIQSLFKVVRIR